jgi:ureidoacrylate peracid hydrolase
MSEDTFSAHRTSDSGTRIDPTRTAVLVVDMINEFCVDGGCMVLPGAERLYGPQNAVIRAARDSGAVVVFLVDSHRKNMRREREFLKRTPHGFEGGWGCQVVADLDKQGDDIVVVKRRYSGFFNTDLDLTLKDMQVDTVVVMGVVTNICVRSTVHDAFFLGYQVFVPEDCVAATGPREQESSLYDIATHFGVVTNSREVVNALCDQGVIQNKVVAA